MNFHAKTCDGAMRTRHCAESGHVHSRLRQKREREVRNGLTSAILKLDYVHCFTIQCNHELMKGMK